MRVAGNKPDIRFGRTVKTPTGPSLSRIKILRTAMAAHSPLPRISTTRSPRREAALRQPCFPFGVPSPKLRGTPHRLASTLQHEPSGKRPLSETVIPRRSAVAESATFAILAAISFSHLLNDMIQSLVPAIYPLLKSSFALNFAQIGLIQLTFQVTASLLQPVVGIYTDRHPLPYSTAMGMGFTLIGLLLLSVAPSFPVLLAAAALVGLGSSVFHPESSRVARMASGGRHGLAQSLFQVGGNAGSAMGPLLAAFIVVPHGRSSVAWFSLVALLAIVVLSRVGHWYRDLRRLAQAKRRAAPGHPALSRSTIVFSLAILMLLIFSKYFYLASLNSYYTFYLIHKFHLSVQAAQLHLFVFLAAVALGTIIGGPVGDRFGRKCVIWFSILGVLPFTLMLPGANLFWTGVLFPL